MTKEHWTTREWNGRSTTKSDVFEGFSLSWEKLLYKFAPRPSYFDLAVWQKIDETDVLQGMALGRFNRSKSTLNLNWVESNLGPNLFKGGVLFPILASAEEYAKLLGAVRVVIKNPVDPKVYLKYGYAPSLNPDLQEALCKELSNGCV